VTLADVMALMVVALLFFLQAESGCIKLTVLSLLLLHRSNQLSCHSTHSLTVDSPR